jgi:hypothetical protein
LPVMLIILSLVLSLSQRQGHCYPTGEHASKLCLEIRRPALNLLRSFTAPGEVSAFFWWVHDKNAINVSVTQ